jgi:hypothetical protein
LAPFGTFLHRSCRARAGSAKDRGRTSDDRFQNCTKTDPILGGLAAGGQKQPQTLPFLYLFFTKTAGDGGKPMVSRASPKPGS